MQKYVAYYRVSTQKQGRSGLGLEAQQEAVRRFAQGQGEVLAAYTEIESGKRSDRPQLAAAIAHCRRARATLLIAKLDRLARNVRFIATLIEDKSIKFRACDYPEAEDVMLQMLAVFAEWEAKQISERVKAALASAKARGVKLGGWRGRPISPSATATLRRNADERAIQVMPAIRDAQAAGITTLKGIARALNDAGHTTARGSAWHAAQVRRVLARAA